MSMRKEDWFKADSEKTETLYEDEEGKWITLPNGRHIFLPSTPDKDVIMTKPKLSKTWDKLGDEEKGERLKKIGIKKPEKYLDVPWTQLSNTFKQYLVKDYYKK